MTWADPESGAGCPEFVADYENCRRNSLFDLVFLTLLASNVLLLQMYPDSRRAPTWSVNSDDLADVIRR